MSNPSTTTSSNPAIPTGAQLAEARLKQWHQQGEALLTLENLRSWINAAGLVLFAPRPQIVSPAPSLVEAVLGEPNAAPTLEQTAEARSLLARLVAEGLAVPLNLLGAVNGVVGETPDFVASSAVFSYVFTLRGDKAWKQPPATTGALKVSQLALATYEALTRRGPLSAYDLTTEVGKEVTEAAVLRALGELWTHLRVLPLAQPDGRPTVWELAGTRFTKQIKAGANAGQPSALSALISLYLGQAVVASEEEIESFLSPLASRSRIRDVIHALLSARQLDTLAVEGRTVLHVTGELPAFLAPAVAEVQGDEIAVEVDAAAEADATGEGAPRITKYLPKPRKIGTGYLAKASPSKFGAKPGGASKFGAAKPRFGAKPGFKSGPAPDRERRPFSKPGIDYAARGFDKPWEEEKARRLAAVAKPSDVAAAPVELAAAEGVTEAPRAPRVYKPREDAGERRGGERSRPSFGGKPSFGSKPAFGRKPSFGGKPSFGSRPSFDDSRPPRRDFAPRAEGDSSERPPRKTFSKPGTFGRKREGFGGKPSFGDSRPPRRDFAPRGERGERPARGDRPAFGAPRAPGSYAPRPKSDRPGGFKPDRAPRGEGALAPRKPYPPRGAGFFSGKPRASDNRPERTASGPGDRQDRGSNTESGKRVYRKFDAPRDRPARPFSSDRPARPAGFAGKPSGDFAARKFAGKPSGRPGAAAGRPSGKPGGGKKPFGKAGGGFSGKPESTFAKFAGNKKPFGKKPPARKFKAKEDESA